MSKLLVNKSQPSVTPAWILAALMLALFASIGLAETDQTGQNPEQSATNSLMPMVGDMVDEDNSSSSTAPRAETADEQGKGGRLPLAQEESLESVAAIPVESEYWKIRVDALVDRAEEVDRTEVTRLYRQMSSAFDKHKKRFVQRTWGLPEFASDEALPYQQPTGKEQLFNTIEVLYLQRIRLLSTFSDDELDEATGTGVRGVVEFNRELAFLRLVLKHRLDTLPIILSDFLDELQSAPLPTVGSFFEFLIAILIFRYWRAWAPKGLFNIRKKLIRARPRTKRNLRVTKLIWYFDQVRNPVAWLILLNVCFGFIDDTDLKFFVELAHIICNWAIWSWIVVLLLNAFISRTSNNLKAETASLILKSLKSLGVWFILCGLSLEVISRYVGEGTLYAWVFLASEVLLALVLLVLVMVWRARIYEACENETVPNSATKAVLENQKGLRGYIYAIYGALYLLRLHCKKVLINWLSNFHTGQQILDSLLGMEMAKAYLRQTEVHGAEPISDDLQETLRKCGNNVISQMGGSILRRIMERVEKCAGGVMVVVGETGVGKTTLLQRIAREGEGKSLMVSCPKEGFDALIAELARKIHLDSDVQTGRVVFEELRQRKIDVLIIDDLHRLIRPYVGGQEGLDKLAELVLNVPDLLLVVSLNSATWRFVSRARSHRIFDRNILKLPAWSSDQLRTLIESSIEAANIKPDFSRVVIPHQYDDNNFDDAKERVFSGFVRILHAASGGNPQVALGLWVGSLYQDRHGRIFARLPQLPSSEDLDKATLTILLVLRVICQSEVICAESIVKSLQITNEEVQGALQLILFHEWVDVEDGYYRINWYWRKEILRVLSRQNLMPRYS